MASRSQSQTTTDHETIRRWAEERNAKPSCVRGTGDEGDIGMIRLDFPGYGGEQSLEEISWDDWFVKFDESGLALLYQDTTAKGEKSNFNKLISREAAEGGIPRREQKRAKAEGRAPRQRGRTRAIGQKKAATGRSTGRRATAGTARSTRAKKAGATSRAASARGTGARKTASRKTAARGRRVAGTAKSAARKTAAKRGRATTAARRTRATAGSRTSRKTVARGTSSRGARTSARGTAKKTTAKGGAKVIPIQSRRAGNGRRGRGRAA